TGCPTSRARLPMPTSPRVTIQAGNERAASAPRTNQRSGRLSASSGKRLTPGSWSRALAVLASEYAHERRVLHLVAHDKPAPVQPQGHQRDHDPRDHLLEPLTLAASLPP